MQATYWLEFLAVPWLAFFPPEFFFALSTFLLNKCVILKKFSILNSLLKLTAHKFFLRNISYVSKVVINDTTIPFLFFVPYILVGPLPHSYK